MDVVFISGMCKTRFFTLKLRLSESQKLRLRLWMMVSNFETENFPSWSLVLWLRLMNLVSNFETVTETLVFWFQSLGPRLRPAKSQIWRLRLFCVDLRLYTFFVAMGQIKVWLLLTRYQNYQLKMVLKTCLYNLAKIRPGSQLLTFVPGRIAVFTHMRKDSSWGINKALAWGILVFSSWGIKDDFSWLTQLFQVELRRCKRESLVNNYNKTRCLGNH